MARSPLGPLFAKIFLSFHEADWLNNCPTSSKLLLYRRYIYDCLLLFHSADRVPQFLSFLNGQHSNIKFTCEVESKLLCTINLLSQVFLLTFTAPFQYKRCLITSLLHRFFSICSSYENFHVELELFGKVFNRNRYPTRLFDSCVRSFSDKVFQPKAMIHSVPKKVIYVCLPFTGTHSLQMRTQINFSSLFISF